MICERRHGMDHIVTRNAKDYAHSPVEAVCPADFLRGMQDLGRKGENAPGGMIAGGRG